MDCLLDTCTFVWLIGRPEALSGRARKHIQNIHNRLFLSSISLWEIYQKSDSGVLLRADVPLDRFCTEQRARHFIEPLPFDEADAARRCALPAIHRDPFDRMLICQALRRNLTILTPDQSIHAYPVTAVW